MEKHYMTYYSNVLCRMMEMNIYGYGGRPVLYIPCQDGRFYDFENFKMADVCSQWINSGKIIVFSIDTIDNETWSNKSVDPRWRIERYDQWIHFITDELAPFINDYVSEKCGYKYEGGIISFGCSLGATHAANLYFRRPDLFDGLLALSGIYTASYGFGDYMDELVYMNSPVDYMYGLPEDHPYIELFNSQRAVICTGQGPWELPEHTRDLDRILKSKDIHTWVDYWGFDVHHDWDWWYKEVVYYMPWLLGESD